MDTAATLTPDQAQQVIYNTLAVSYGLPDAISKIITAQSGHETAGWTSNVYNQDNNCFGFGYDGAGNYYAYNDIEASVQDVVNWLSVHVPGFASMTDPTAYAQALSDAGYYTDSVSNYANGIINYFNNNLTPTTAGIGVAAIVGIGLLLWFMFKGK
jgi:flagellum-specific peptidoglycan hydrolase FlgJ